MTLGALYWHVITKAQAVAAFLRGRRGVARVLWRWMANRPTPADLEQAKRTLARPDVQAELARLRTEHTLTLRQDGES